MIILAIVKIAKGEGKVAEVKYFNWQYVLCDRFIDPLDLDSGILTL
jgi:hypothetical protein